MSAAAVDDFEDREEQATTPTQQLAPTEVDAFYNSPAVVRTAPKVEEAASFPSTTVAQPSRTPAMPS